jgi:type VI secretion system protein ImpI
MALRFTIENVPNLPDGGPISFAVTGKRSVDIGRDQHLDWTLPDPTRFISGKHCEVHYRNDAYWLHDVSTNGTFLNGSDQRVRSPHQLKNGDRLLIGQYIVVVSLETGGAPTRSKDFAAASEPIAQQHAAYPELWASDKDAPPPIERAQIKMAREAARPIHPDFLDWAAGVPEADSSPGRRPAAARLQPAADMDWANGPPSRPLATPEPPPPMAAPRRPVWKDNDLAPREIAPSDAVPLVTPPSLDAVEAPAPRAEPQPNRPVAPPSSRRPGEDQDFLRRIARAASLPEDFFAGKDPDQLADQLGEIMRVTVGSMMMLLQARNAAKRLTRSTTQTTIQATENNPLKFSPSAEEAMRIMFGPKTHSYLDARRAFAQGFEDLKSHQLKTYAAMQHAVTMLMAEIDPGQIAKGVDGDEGLLDKMRSRKSRLWDAFLIRWKANLGRDSGSAIEAFMLHFADYYDRDGGAEPR